MFPGDGGQARGAVSSVRRQGVRQTLRSAVVRRMQGLLQAQHPAVVLMLAIFGYFSLLFI